MTKVISYTPDNMRPEHPEVERTELFVVGVSDLAKDGKGEIHYFHSTTMLDYIFKKDVQKARMLTEREVQNIIDAFDVEGTPVHYASALGFTDLILHRIPVALVTSEAKTISYYP